MYETTAQTTVLRADFGAYRRWFGKPIHGLPLLLGLIGGGIATAFRRGDGVLLFWLLAGAVVATLGFIAILIATSRVILTADAIESRQWFVRTRLRRDDDLIGALAELKASPVGRTSQVLVLRARSGGRRIRLNGAYWDQADLVHIAGAAGVPVVEGEALTPKEFHRIAPGSMPWRALHPWAFGLGAAIVAMALLIGGVVAWWDAKGLPPFDDQPPRAVSARTVAAQDSLLAALERTLGGDWERPDVRLVTCRDSADYKGWRRDVSADLRQTFDDATGEDRVDTPITPSRELIDAIGTTLVDAGHPELYVDPEELARFVSDGYLDIASFPEDDGVGAVEVFLTFSGDEGRASISLDSPCETPDR